MATNLNKTEEIFNNLAQKFSQLYGRTEKDPACINKILDDLNSLDYKLPVVSNSTKAVLLINQCCSLVLPDNLILVAKSCQLLTNLINHQHILIEGKTLSVVIEWCLQSLNQVNDSNTKVNVLIIIESLIKSNKQYLTVLTASLVATGNPVLELAQTEQLSKCVLLALQCLEACTHMIVDNFKKADDKDKSASHLQICAVTFLKHLTNKHNEHIDDKLYLKILIVCLRGLQNIVLLNCNYLSNNLGLLLGTVKSYMVYGINGINFILPTKIMPSVLSIPEPTSGSVIRENKGGKVTKQRKPRTSACKKERTDIWIDEDNNSNYSTSDSCFFDFNSTSVLNKLKANELDVSDSENIKIAEVDVLYGYVRQAALCLFLNITKVTSKRILFSYWSSFIPDGSPAGNHLLTTCILKDSSPRGRMAAFNVLLSLLTSSKMHLFHAEYCDRVPAFTPFSITLGFMIQELHECLILALNENSMLVLTQALKCLAALVQATPYHKLKSGLITKIIMKVKMFIYHRDPTVQVAALIVLGCLLSSEPLIPETKDVLLTDDQMKKKTVHSEHESEETKCMSWLLQKCLHNLGVPIDEKKSYENIAAPVKLESLQVMSAMSRNYFGPLMSKHMSQITKALVISLSDNYTDLRLHAGRTVDFIGQAINISYTSNDEHLKIFTLEEGKMFWQTLLDGPLISLFENEHHPILRAVGCDCLGSIGSNIFENLSRDKQILMITILISCSQEEENSVKGAAVRALAICVLYPSLRQDTGFICDATEIIHKMLQDENVTVRIKASWSLGNLSSSLVLNRTEKTIKENIPEELLLKLLRASIKGCNDNDKVRMNTVRALGNLLQLITTDLIKKVDVNDIVEPGIEALVKNSVKGSNMKVRWNSCYALGNAMKNTALYAYNENWQNSVFTSLTNLVINFRNFKVRINAALALSSVPTRALYGRYYLLVWKSLLQALENSQNIEDFTEYKHRNDLVEQICLSIGHLTTLLTIDDLLPLNDSLNFHCDCLKRHMRRVQESMLPEKSTILFSASAFITSLLDCDLQPLYKNTLRHLTEIFICNI